MEIGKYDNTLNNPLFITKVDNIFIMLHTSIMQQDILRVRHKISDELYKQYLQKENDFKEKHLRQMYDELNVKSTAIDNIHESEEEIKVYVTLVSRYLDYIVDENFNLVSGNNTSRVEKTNKLEFVKKKDSHELKAARRCTSCGAPADLNNTGICPYCNATHKTQNYDYILNSIETI